jgi:hypothetical protein
VLANTILPGCGDAAVADRSRDDHYRFSRNVLIGKVRPVDRS